MCVGDFHFISTKESPHISSKKLASIVTFTFWFHSEEKPKKLAILETDSQFSVYKQAPKQLLVLIQDNSSFDEVIAAFVQQKFSQTSFARLV